MVIAAREARSRWTEETTMTQANGGAGVGTLTLNLRHPASAFAYNATKPRVFIDGGDVALPDWGTYRIPVAAGQRRVQVWVPYILPRKAGKAAIDVTVGAGQEIALEYMAPTVTFAKGSLGEPGKQKSTGFSTVMAFNVAAVVLILALFVAAAVLN